MGMQFSSDTKYDRLKYWVSLEGDQENGKRKGNENENETEKKKF